MCPSTGKRPLYETGSVVDKTKSKKCTLPDPVRGMHHAERLLEIDRSDVYIDITAQVSPLLLRRGKWQKKKVYVLPTGSGAISPQFALKDSANTAAGPKPFICFASTSLALSKYLRLNIHLSV